MSSTELWPVLDSVNAPTRFGNTAVGDSDYGACLRAIISSDTPYQNYVSAGSYSNILEEIVAGSGWASGCTNISLRINAVLRCPTDPGSNTLNFILYLLHTFAATPVPDFGVISTGEHQGIAESAVLTINPVTGLPWTYEEIMSYEWGLQLIVADSPLKLKSFTVSLLNFDLPITANAGEDANCLLSEGYNLLGTVSIGTILWTKENGPGNVTFDDNTSLTTHVNFDENGKYLLKLTATNGSFLAYSYVVITVLDLEALPTSDPVL